MHIKEQLCKILPHAWYEHINSRSLINYSPKYFNELFDSKKSILIVTCMDENGNHRQPGESWDMDGLMGMTCSCDDSGNTECSFGSGGWGNYGFGNYGW